MNQITQKDLINLIKDKQENAKNDYRRVSNDTGFRTLEESRIRIIRQEREKAFIDAYQDLICYLDSVEIVPERIEANVGQFVGGEELHMSPEDLKKLFERAPITPYIEPKVEPLRNDRFKEFEFFNGAKRTIDAKAVKSINIQESFKSKTQHQVYVDSILIAEGDVYEGLVKIYNDLVAWWKYWKQN